MVYSLDALFGLPRKKSAGRSFRQPVHGDIFFCDQGAVDEFVNSSKTLKASAQVWIVVSVCWCLQLFLYFVGVQRIFGREYVEKCH